MNVLGYSWGGALAQAFVKRYPERCHKLVLAATSAGHTMFPGRAFLSLRPANYKLLLQPEYLFNLVLDREGNSAAKGGQKSIWQKSTLPTNSLGYVNQWMSLLGWSSLPWLHTIRHRTLVIHAKDDQLVSSWNACAWRVRNPYTKSR